MKKQEQIKLTYLLHLVCLLTGSAIYSQKASDVLEDGISMNNSQIIIFNKAEKKDMDDKTIEYEILDGKIGIVKDSAIFLVKGELVKTFMTPLNPLDYSYEGKSEQKPDQIDVAVADALKSLITYVGNYTGVSAEILTSGNRPQIENCQSKFTALNTEFGAIKKMLETDYKAEIATTFQKLKDLDFVDKDITKAGIDTAQGEITAYSRHYSNIDDRIKDFKNNISAFNCGAAEHDFLIQGLFNEKVKDLELVKAEQFKRVGNLEIAFNEVNKVYQLASRPKKCGDWCLPINPDTKLDKGKITVNTFTIKKSGFRLSTVNDKKMVANEIIVEESKDVVQKVFLFRKFRRFVPEVSAGIAYTNLNFPKYSAVTDDTTGELKVAEIGNDNIKRLNITAMLNYNYFVADSDIHPFIQLGAGINTDFPTLFIGSGLRFNAFNGGRLAISCGFAGSWIKSLKSLKVGDVVEESADVEKDIEYEFAKPKLYYGIQYNF